MNQKLIRKSEESNIKSNIHSFKKMKSQIIKTRHEDTLLGWAKKIELAHFFLSSPILIERSVPSGTEFIHLQLRMMRYGPYDISFNLQRTASNDFLGYSLPPLKWDLSIRNQENDRKLLSYSPMHQKYRQKL
jgi:hypothetical protein